MKKILFAISCLTALSTSVAMGPNEINFNGTRFYKSNERSQKNVLISEYEPNNNSSANIILTHVLDKNDPSQIAASLKQKKTIEVMDVENLNPENSDVLVTFVKFDNASSKVENSLCRIIKNPGENGSLVFQYMDTKNLNNKGEGAAIPDFTAVADSIKQLPLDKYLTTMSETKTYYPSNARRRARYDNQYEGYNSNVPWYKRPGARTGATRESGYRQYRSR